MNLYCRSFKYTFNVYTYVSSTYDFGTCYNVLHRGQVSGKNLDT